MINIKFQSISKDLAPTQGHSGDACWDLYCAGHIFIGAGTVGKIPTGVSLEIPEGMAGFIWPRSGLSAKSSIDVLAGVIDSGYRGEIQVLLLNNGEDFSAEPGSRIAQIHFAHVPLVNLVRTHEDLEDSERGEGGFGSTGV